MKYMIILVTGSTEEEQLLVEVFTSSIRCFLESRCYVWFDVARVEYLHQILKKKV